MPDKLQELRIPLIIDAGVILVAVMGYGILWNKVDTLVTNVAQIQAVVESERTGTSNGRTSTAERLARVEAEVRMTRQDIGEIKQMLREDRK